MSGDRLYLEIFCVWRSCVSGDLVLNESVSLDLVSRGYLVFQAGGKREAQVSSTLGGVTNSVSLSPSSAPLYVQLYLHVLCVCLSVCMYVFLCVPGCVFACIDGSASA